MLAIKCTRSYSTCLRKYKPECYNSLQRERGNRERSRDRKSEEVRENERKRDRERSRRMKLSTAWLSVLKYLIYMFVWFV